MASRPRLPHLIEEQILTVDVDSELAGPALLDRVARLNRSAFSKVLGQVLDAFDTPGELIRIERLSVALGSFTPHDLDRAGGILRERLRAALGEALHRRGNGVSREREDRAWVAAFEHYLLHGTWPAAHAIAPALRPAALLAQLIAEDPLALVAMLRRRGSSEALLRRLVRQMPDALLAPLLHRLEPVHAAYVLTYLGEVRESHAAERLISANPAELAEILWTIVLRDALQQSGLQANRKAFLRRLLVQLARSGGTTLAALIAQLRRGLPRVLARQRAPGSLVAILSELIAEEPAILAGQAGIAELARLLRQTTLSPREQRDARRIAEAVDPGQLRWLLQRLARGDAARLDGVLPLRKALGPLWGIDATGLPAALESLAANKAERIALLALAAQPAGRGDSAADSARAVLARMRGVAVEQVGLPPSRALPRRLGPSDACLALMTILTEASAAPQPSELARIREHLARALTADPFRTRQLLRDFAAADAPRLCMLLGAADAPDQIAQHLLPPQLHAALAALAGFASCTQAEWAALLAVAAEAKDYELPENLLVRGTTALARSRDVPVAQLLAELSAAASSQPALRGASLDDATIRSLFLPPTRAVGRLVSHNMGLEQLAFLADSGAAFFLSERVAALTQLLPRLSGIASTALRSRLSTGPALERLLSAISATSLARLAILLAIPKPELRRLAASELPTVIIATVAGNSPHHGQYDPANALEDARARTPAHRNAQQRKIATLLKARPFTALRMIAAHDAPCGLAPLLEKPQTSLLLFAAMAPAERTRTSELLRILTGRSGRLAIAPEKVARALALAAAAQDWQSRGGRGFATEWLRQLTTHANLAEQAALRRLLAKLPTGREGDAADGKAEDEAVFTSTAPLLFATMAPVERDRASALLRLLTSRKGRLAIAAPKIAHALALAAQEARRHGGSGFTAEWLRQLHSLASLAEQAALRRLLAKLPAHRGSGDTDGRTPDGEAHPGVLARAAILLSLRANSVPSALLRKLDQPRNRALLASELSEAESVQLLAILAPTAASGLLHAAERLSAARRAAAAPLSRAAQWDCIFAAAGSARPIVQLAGLVLDGSAAAPAPPAPLQRRVETALAAALEGMRDAPLRIALDLREGERKRRDAEAQPKDSDEAPATLYIANAGLVLASAFLPRLFQSLDYVEPDPQQGWRWSDTECRARAVHLLQWLVDERTDAPEPQLALNKILCGLAPSEPVAVEVKLDERELRMANTMLRTILASWPPLAGSGTAALRETFFQRQGRLTCGEAGWRLEVETRVLDVLIDQMPWGFATILHPWMPAPLTVQWR